MSTETKTLIKALHVLANDIQSEDGVANAVISEAANRLEELSTLNTGLIPIESIEDITTIGEEILIWDGCDYEIDYMDVCPDMGFNYMANGTEPVSWMPLIKPIESGE